MVKSKRKSYKKRQHIQKVKGRRFTDEIRNLDLEKVLVVPIDPSLRKAPRKPPWYKGLIFYIRLHSVFHSCSLKFFPIQKMAKTKLLKNL